MARADKPEISLIVPVLNEEKNLPVFLESLVQQREIVFEVVFCDGGSKDRTLAFLDSRKRDLMLRTVRTERGRGRQMNQGARYATTTNLLFLHSDSILEKPLFLRRAVDAFERQIEKASSQRIAGHFALRFLRSDSRSSLGYYYYECKTRLNRPGCINGDQGFFIRRAFFQELGGFDQSLGFLEDERMAQAIFAQGRWVLLPGEILTSARRFEVEGLYERQLLNALIMNFSAIGWDVFFVEAAGIYRLQEENGRLELRPFFKQIAALLRQEGWKRRLALWYRTGTYINENAWQLAFFLDVRRSFRKLSCQRDISTPRLEAFDRRWKVFVHHRPGFAITAILTWFWFHGYRTWMGMTDFIRRRRPGR